MKKRRILIILIAVLTMVGCGGKEFIPKTGKRYCDGYCITCMGKMGNDVESAWVGIKEKYAEEYPERRPSDDRQLLDFKWRHDNRTFWEFNFYDEYNNVADMAIVDSKGFYYTRVLID